MLQKRLGNTVEKKETKEREEGTKDHNVYR